MTWPHNEAESFNSPVEEKVSRDPTGAKNPVQSLCSKIPNSQSLTGEYSRLWHMVVVVDYIPQSGTKNLASDTFLLVHHWLSLKLAPPTTLVLARRSYYLPNRVKKEQKRGQEFSHYRCVSVS